MSVRQKLNLIVENGFEECHHSLNHLFFPLRLGCLIVAWREMAVRQIADLNGQLHVFVINLQVSDIPWTAEKVATGSLPSWMWTPCPNRACSLGINFCESVPVMTQRSSRRTFRCTHQPW